MGHRKDPFFCPSHHTTPMTYHPYFLFCHGRVTTACHMNEESFRQEPSSPGCKIVLAQRFSWFPACAGGPGWTKEGNPDITPTAYARLNYSRSFPPAQRECECGLIRVFSGSGRSLLRPPPILSSLPPVEHQRGGTGPVFCYGINVRQVFRHFCMVQFCEQLSVPFCVRGSC